ncbi:MAG: hypothetical protein HYV95_03680 [Opitutae bacterium]|nr:hypothetical protein [Opitutae bacterium]
MKTAQDRTLYSAQKMPPPFPETGRLFAAGRKRLGWSQQMFADVSGYSLRLIQKAEAGHAIDQRSHYELVQALAAHSKKRMPVVSFNDIPFPHDVVDRRRTSRPAVAPLANPHLVAMFEALRHTAPKTGKARLRMGKIRTEGELHDLWTIDNEAYGEGNITFDHFLDLWRAFPSGLHVLFHENEIMGAMGIWPVTRRWSEQIKSAKLKEAELDARMVRLASRRPSCHWYITGLMLRVELIGKGGCVKNLLNGALGSWLNDLYVRYPCEILALAYSDHGDRLLQGFGFHITQHKAAMPDNCALYRLMAGNELELVKLFRARNLDLKLT